MSNCLFRWQDADTPSNLDVEADDYHVCELPDTHPGPHRCVCDAEHDTGHEPES
jgi:hypothetical protein